MKFCKKIFAALLAVMFLAFEPLTVSAADDLEANKAAAVFAKSESTEDFIASLPVTKSKYKSSQRPILIGGAMYSEIGVLVRALKNPTVYKRLNYDYIVGTYKNYPVIISHTEISCSNAAATTAIALLEFNPVAVINQGTCGGYIEELNLEDIVIGERYVNTGTIKTDYQPAGAGIDMTQQVLFGDYVYNRASGKFENCTELFADPTLLKLAESISGFRTMKGTIGTTMGWNSNIDYINFLHEKYSVICEEMETNSAAGICSGSGVPFIGVRVISNNISNASPYQPQTAEVSQKFALALAEKYIHEVLKK